MKKIESEKKKIGKKKFPKKKKFLVLEKIIPELGKKIKS